MLTAILEIFNIIHAYRTTKDYYKTAGAFKKILILFGIVILACLGVGAVYLALYLFELSPGTTNLLGGLLTRLFCWIGGACLIVCSIAIMLRAIMYFMAIIISSFAQLGIRDKHSKTTRGFDIFIAIFNILVIAGFVVGAVYFIKNLML